MSDSAFAIFGRKHVMVDIESFSRRQHAAIISIGAVRFTFENGIEDEFLVNVNPASCKEIGLDIDPDTVEWWGKQPRETRLTWQTNPTPGGIVESLHALNEFVGKDKQQMLWAQGSVFDFGILSEAFAHAGIKKGWMYWSENDMRTIMSLMGIRNDQIRATQGGHHSAMDDARSQAETLIGIFKELA